MVTGDKNTAWIAGIAGVVSQFLSATIFWLHSKTLDQVKDYSEKTFKSQQMVFQSMIEDKNVKED
nr:hypothetical protein [Terasakiella sp. SH-1]